MELAAPTSLTLSELVKTVEMLFIAAPSLEKNNKEEEKLFLTSRELMIASAFLKFV